MASESRDGSGEVSLGRKPLNRFYRQILYAILPGWIASIILILLADWSRTSKLAMVCFMSVVTLLAAAQCIAQWRYWLGTLSNLVSSLREEDYSFRVRRAHRDDPMGELVMEINQLADQLRERRLDRRESDGLLRNVMQEIPVCVFTFDSDRRLRFVNRMGERILGLGTASALGKSAEAIGLARCLDESSPCTLELSFGGGLGRWGLRRSVFRQEGRPHQLVVLTDLSQTLREEERLAWQRIVRVIGHEINNSLAPIQSLADSLDKMIAKRNDSSELRKDLHDGLSVIRTRSEALSRLMQSYARLARLPKPTMQDFDASDWVSRAVTLEQRVAVLVEDGPKITLHADRDQLDQVLINLLNNAAEAALQRSESLDSVKKSFTPSIRIEWSIEGKTFVLSVQDNGAGISTRQNLFVPFYTTKSGGSGIGLALCRQIVESHNGFLTLQNRENETGAEAILRLPLPEA